MSLHNLADHIIINSRYCRACFKYIEVCFKNMLYIFFILFYKHVHTARPAADIGCTRLLHINPGNVTRLQ